MHFYSSAAFLDAVADVYFPGRSRAVEDVLCGDQVLRVLVIDDSHVVNCAEFLDYHVPVGRRDGATITLRRSYSDRVCLGEMPADEWLALSNQKTHPAPYIDLTAFKSFPDYLAFATSRRKGTMKDIERRRRRLTAAHGPLQFRLNDPGEDVLEAATRWKRAQFKLTGVADILTPQNVRFLKELRARGIANFSTLRAGDTLIAVWIGFVHDGVFSGWIFTHNPDPVLKSFSPGHQMILSIIDEALRLGLQQVDFSIGDEEYKWIYSTHVRVIGKAGKKPILERIAGRVRYEFRRCMTRMPRVRQALARASLLSFVGAGNLVVAIDDLWASCLAVC